MLTYVCIVIRDRVSNARVYGVASIVGILLSLVACASSVFLRRLSRHYSEMSFIEYSADCDFPIQNLPYGIFSTAADVSCAPNQLPPFLAKKPYRSLYIVICMKICM